MSGGGPFRGPKRPSAFRPTTLSGPPAFGLSDPPDGLETILAQWGYDIDESREVKLTGERSLWFKNTATDQKRMQHTTAHMAPVEAGKRYKAHSVFQADSLAGGKLVKTFINWKAADKTTGISSSTVYSNVVTAIDTWQRAELVATAPAGAVYAAMSFGTDGGSFNAYFDEVDMVPAVPSWEAWIDVGTPAQVLATSTDETIAYDTVTATDVTFSTTTGIATIIVPGFYYLAALINIALMGDDTRTFVIIRVNGATDHYLTRYNNYAGGAGTTASIITSGAVLTELAAGDTVAVIVNHDHGANRSVSSGKTQTRFSGTRIM